MISINFIRAALVIIAASTSIIASILFISSKSIIIAIIALSIIALLLIQHSSYQTEKNSLDIELADLKKDHEQIISELKETKITYEKNLLDLKNKYTTELSEQIDKTNILEANLEQINSKRCEREYEIKTRTEISETLKSCLDIINNEKK